MSVDWMAFLHGWGSGETWLVYDPSEGMTDAEWSGWNDGEVESLSTTGATIGVVCGTQRPAYKTRDDKAIDGIIPKTPYGGRSQTSERLFLRYLSPRTEGLPIPEANIRIWWARAIACVDGLTKAGV